MKDVRIEVSRVSTGRAGKRRHTLECIYIDRGRPRESLRVVASSTCTCSAIHHPAGDKGCSGEMPFRAHHKAACGVIAHPIGVN